MSNPRDFRHVLSTRRWSILVTTAIAVLIAVAYVVVKHKTYTAAASVQYSVQTDLGVIDPGVSTPVDLNPSETASALTRVVTRSDVVAAVKQATRSPLTTATLKGMVNASVEPTSNLIDIGVSARSGALAATLANAFARATQTASARDTRATYAQELQSLQAKSATGDVSKSTRRTYNDTITRLSELSLIANPVSIVRQATAPSAPSSPKPAEDIALALVLGLLAGIGVAYGRASLDQRFTEASEVEKHLSRPLIGQLHETTLGKALEGEADHPVPPAMNELEAFRVLRTNVEFLAPDTTTRTIAITSALAEEGKSTVATWLAYVSAAKGATTLLVDCDLRKPRLAERFKLQSQPGLTDYLTDDADPADILQVVEVAGPDAVPLTVITAGRHVDQPGEAVASKRFQSFVEEVSAVYDLVVFDTAPALLVSDTLQLIAHVDSVLLCVRLGQTKRSEAAAALHAIEALPERPIGLVATGVNPRDATYYYGYYGTDEPIPRKSRLKVLGKT